tara:strand:+ start:235 stop:552 length:318 start_codon:yes stop_codon:yes gene_type:complete
MSQTQQQRFLPAPVGACNGTSLSGYIGERFTPAQVIDAFGPGIGSGDKTNFEWVFVRDDGVPFTVYDYKAFIGLETQYDFHIGSTQGDVKEFASWFANKVKAELS